MYRGRDCIHTPFIEGATGLPRSGERRGDPAGGGAPGPEGGARSATFMSRGGLSSSVC